MRKISFIIRVDYFCGVSIQQHVYQICTIFKFLLLRDVFFFYPFLVRSLQSNFCEFMRVRLKDRR